MDMPGIEPGTLCNHDDCEADIIPLDHMPCSVVVLSQIKGLYPWVSQWLRVSTFGILAVTHVSHTDILTDNGPCTWRSHINLTV